MRIRKSQLRKLISEVINTWKPNHYTSYDDPWSVENDDGMDLDVQSYANLDGTTSVKIVCGWNNEYDQPLRVFKSEDDAGVYINKKTDEIYRAYLNSGDL